LFRWSEPKLTDVSVLVNLAIWLRPPFGHRIGPLLRQPARNSVGNDNSLTASVCPARMVPRGDEWHQVAQRCALSSARCLASTSAKANAEECFIRNRQIPSARRLHLMHARRPRSPWRGGGSALQYAWRRPRLPRVVSFIVFRMRPFATARIRWWKPPPSTPGKSMKT